MKEAMTHSHAHSKKKNYIFKRTTPIIASGIESQIFLDIMVVNAEKEAALGTFSEERMIQFL